MRYHLPVLAAVVSGLAIALTGPARAQIEIFPDPNVTWTVQPAFGQAGEGRDNVSGVTCFGGTPLPARPTCLVVNDSARFGQYFTIRGNTIQPGPLVGISGNQPPSRITGSPNLEGAAHDDRFFYVVTSKGRVGFPTPTVNTDFLVGRFPPDVANPPPAPPGTVPGLQVSDRFRTALTTGIAVPGVPTQQLNRTNSDIQGIAIAPGVSVRQQRVNLGFRTPVFDGKAFIMSAPVTDVFATSGTFAPTVTPVALGADVGIRDLATVADGILILAAKNAAGPQRPALFLLQADGQLRHLADIAQPTNQAAEALLVLRDDPELFILLVMFDGVANGGPLQYVVPR